MAAPLRLAVTLAEAGHDVRFSTTTRSPPSSSTSPITRSPAVSPSPRTTTPPTVPARDTPTTSPGAGTTSWSWSIRPPTPRPAHRIAHRAGAPHPRAPRSWSHREPRPRSRCAGPPSAATRPTRSRWLLTDLSGVALEAPTEEREEAVQSGGAHYAESLPHEYQPDAAYLGLYREALAASAARLAQAVGVVAELVLAERGRDVVLVSLARAGTPVGVLLRRWAAARHGLDAAALRCVDRPRPRHRPARAAPPRRAPRPGPSRVRRRLDRQGRDQPRAGRGAARHPVLPRARRARRPRPLHAHLRHPRRLAHPLGVPQLDGVRAGLTHGPQRPADPPRHVPRREVLRASSRRADVSTAFLDAVAAEFPAVTDTRPPPTARRTSRAARASSASRRSTASATSTSSSPGSARPRACCCAACRGRCSSGPARPPPTSRTCGCWPRSAGCRSRRCPSCPTAASG